MDSQLRVGPRGGQEVCFRHVPIVRMHYQILRTRRCLRPSPYFEEEHGQVIVRSWGSGHTAVALNSAIGLRRIDSDSEGKRLSRPERSRFW